MRTGHSWKGRMAVLLGAVAVTVARGTLAADVSPGTLTVGSPVSMDATDAPSADFPGGARAAIRLDDKQRQIAGATFGTVERRSLEKMIRTVARFDVDERKVAVVTLKVGGYVDKLVADSTGKAVRKGEPLFSIYSPDLVSAEQEYLLARETQKALGHSQLPSASESAAGLLRASRERLKLWDLTEAQIRQFERSGKPDLRQTILSPVSGVVLEKMVVAGQSVQAGMALYRIADLSTIWVYGDIYEHELPFVKIGQAADIRLSYAPDRTFRAKVSYVYPTVEPKTRTVRVRFELPNTDGFLRPEMFGSVELHVPLGEQLVVPKTALLDTGRRQLVFVAEGGGKVTPRPVQIGDRTDNYVAVKEGLASGERVVTSANFLVDSEAQLQGADSMMGMMGAIGMGDWKMETAKPMSMGEGGEPPAPAITPAAIPRDDGSAPNASMPEGKKVGDLWVSLVPAGGAVKPGAGAIRVRVHDASGAPVAKAKVRFDSTMEMPGMSTETAEATDLGDGTYEGTAKFEMSGPWSVVVQIDRPGKPTLRERFVVRVEG